MPTYYYTSGLMVFCLVVGVTCALHLWYYRRVLRRLTPEDHDKRLQTLNTLIKWCDRGLVWGKVGIAVAVLNLLFLLWQWGV